MKDPKSSFAPMLHKQDVESLPSRASGSNDWIEPSILFEKTERADFAIVAKGYDG